MHDADSLYLCVERALQTFTRYTVPSAVHNLKCSLRELISCRLQRISGCTPPGCGNDGGDGREVEKLWFCSVHAKSMCASGGRERSHVSGVTLCVCVRVCADMWHGWLFDTDIMVSAGAYGYPVHKSA